MPGLAACIVVGGLTGAGLVVAGSQGALVVTLLRAVGGVVGWFAGYRAGAALVKILHAPNTYVVLAEDLVAVTVPVDCFAILVRSVNLNHRTAQTDVTIRDQVPVLCSDN
jgi:hypothetical protein